MSEGRSSSCIQIPQDSSKKGNSGREEGWTNQLDFLFSCISLSVGLGNVWRFPYLCYKNGGGAFVVTYTIAMVLCGIPIFFQEVAIGQYLGVGGMNLVGELCPILKGVGFATMTIVFLLDVYYCIIIAWTIFYIIATCWYGTMGAGKLPWAECGKWCSNGNSTTVVEQFFEKRVLNLSEGLQEVGMVQWELFGCLLGGWLLIYVIIRKGLHQSGKVIWFTALFPYLVLIILLVRAVTLKGALKGLTYLITPDWGSLLTVAPWMEGATQIFFAYSIGCGALPALGSYNKFHHNCYRDALITCCINTATSLMAGVVTFSILGYIAQEQGAQVADVVKSGPGLVFLTYPEVVLKLPGSIFWALTFFLMLLILGIDSEFCLVESFITGMVDNWGNVLKPHRDKFTAGICLLMFLLGIPMVTQGGMFIFQLMDYYAASGMSLLWVCIFQTVAISWCFGVENLANCIEEMLGHRPNFIWKICWKIFAPLTMIAIFLGHCIQYSTLKYGPYSYPKWAEVVGLCISWASMGWIPLYALYYIFVAGPNGPLQNLRDGFRSKIPRRHNENGTGSIPNNNFPDANQNV